MSWRSGAAAPFFDVLQAASHLHLSVQVGSRDDAREALEELRALCGEGGAADRAIEVLPDERLPVPDDALDRAARMRELHEEHGLTLAEVGLRFGVSRQAVQACLLRASQAETEVPGA